MVSKMWKDALSPEGYETLANLRHTSSARAGVKARDNALVA
jgi:hypothetical protein